MRRLLLLSGLALVALDAAGPALGQDNPLGVYSLGGTGGGGDSLDGNPAFRSWIDQPKTVTGSDGTAGTMQFNADGTATRSDSLGAVDGGTWRHHEFGFCTTWAKDAAGQERCYSIGTGNGQTYITLQGADGPAYYVKP